MCPCYCLVLVGTSKLLSGSGIKPTLSKILLVGPLLFWRY